MARRFNVVQRVSAVVAAALALAGAAAAAPAAGTVEGKARSSDGVEIAYTARGSGSTALVFIHGGLADRAFWRNQLAALADRYRVVALDLAGHGESGSRPAYSMVSWAQDVRVVVEALGLTRVVLIGNSLGGPVAIEAARLLPGKVLGAVGVDTLHDLTRVVDAATSRAQAEALRTDFAAGCRGMVNQLFHPGTYLEVRAWAEKRMCDPAHKDLAVGMMEGFGGYDVAPAARAAGVPIRAINGDLWPIAYETNRTVVKDFDAKVMKGCGHYPMLERPAEFNGLLVETVQGLEREAAARR